MLDSHKHNVILQQTRRFGKKKSVIPASSNVYQLDVLEATIQRLALPQHAQGSRQDADDSVWTFMRFAYVAHIKASQQKMAIWSWPLPTMVSSRSCVIESKCQNCYRIHALLQTPIASNIALSSLRYLTQDSARRRQRSGRKCWITQDSRSDP